MVSVVLSVNCVLSPLLYLLTWLCVYACGREQVLRTRIFLLCIKYKELFLSFSLSLCVCVCVCVCDREGEVKQMILPSLHNCRLFCGVICCFQNTMASLSHTHTQTATHTYTYIHTHSAVAVC